MLFILCDDLVVMAIVFAETETQSRFSEQVVELFIATQQEKGKDVFDIVEKVGVFCEVCADVRVDRIGRQHLRLLVGHKVAGVDHHWQGDPAHRDVHSRIQRRYVDLHFVFGDLDVERRGLVKVGDLEDFVEKEDRFEEELVEPGEGAFAAANSDVSVVVPHFYPWNQWVHFDFRDFFVVADNFEEAVFLHSLFAGEH